MGPTVRVTNRDHNGYVEFNFSVDDPRIYLEMTLPPAAFAEFCATHKVTELNPAQARAVDASQTAWRFGAGKED